MRYDSYRYLWPPRPEKAAPPELIEFYWRRGWLAQVKKNGTCTVIFANGGQVIFKTRHNDDHKAWSPQARHVQFFGQRQGWNVYVAELLHSKGPTLKNHLYLFDILVNDGVELTGTTLCERQTILRTRFPSPRADIIGSRAGLGARMICDDVSQAENLTDPSAAWAALGTLDEGLVFKNPTAKLAPCLTEKSNGEWQIKIRLPHSNYSF